MHLTRSMLHARITSVTLWIAGGLITTSLLAHPILGQTIQLNSHSRIVDLAYPLNAENAYWPGENYEPFELRTIATLEKDGVLSKAFSMPEHLGTHIDAPNHFEANQPSVDQLTLQNLVGPGVVIDISMQGEIDADAMLTVEDITRWETQHGRILESANRSAQGTSRRDSSEREP